jgi:hypothetical protein
MFVFWFMVGFVVTALLIRLRNGSSASPS